MRTLFFYTVLKETFPEKAEASVPGSRPNTIPVPPAFPENAVSLQVRFMSSDTAVFLSGKLSAVSAGSPYAFTDILSTVFFSLRTF